MPKIKNNSFAAADSKSCKTCLVSFSQLLILHLPKKRKKKKNINTVFSRFFKLRKRLSTSKLAMTYFQSVLVISSANAKVSLTVYSLIINGDKLGARNFANLYDCVLMASSIGLKGGQILMTGLCILKN